MPEKTRRNSDRVGLKTNLGGQVWAADSGLNAVITIHSTGRKNAIPTTHATIPQPTFPDISRSLRGPGCTGTAVISCPLELEDPGEHPQRERGHDDGQDDGDHAGRGRPAYVTRVVHLLEQVEGEVGSAGPATAVGHQPDRVEHVEQVDRAEQDPELDVGPWTRERPPAQ